MPLKTLVPPRSTPMTRFPSKARGYPTPSMATGEKPYRVYRGGRVKGRVPLERPQTRPDRNGREPRQPKVRRPRRRWSWKRRIGIILLVLLVLIIVWGIAGYLSFRSGVRKANARLDPSVPAVLAKQSGLLLSNPSTLLLLGRDHENTDQRVGLNHSDSIMILRTDPSRHRLVYLSIPRDLRVPIPGYGEDRINTAFPRGGAALAVRTIQNFTGLRINGDSLLTPLTTDLTAWQLIQLGWVMKRAGQKNALHCRLGGTSTSIGGASVIVGTEQNLSVIQMVTGRSAVQPPLPGSGPYGPGCVTGSQQFRCAGACPR